MSIRCGTSGWRAVIADNFTFENVELVTEAICRSLNEKSEPGGQTLIVGNDSRFMGDKFAAVAAGIAARNGFRVLQCNGPTPTISHAIRSNNGGRRY